MKQTLHYSLLLKIENSLFFSEVLVGELNLKEDPDCTTSNFCAPSPQKLSVENVKIHEKWNSGFFQKGFDIALVRVDGSINLFVSKTIIFYKSHF